MEGLLCITSKPKDGESLLGYLVRLTDLNLYDSPHWILELAEMRVTVQTATRTLVFDSDKPLDGLARVCGVSAEVLNSLRYPRTGGTGLTAFHRFNDSVVLPKYMLSVNYCRLCPECLADFGYCRKVWDLYCLTACPLHRRMLFDRCPNCGASIKGMRRSLARCRCGCDWRGVKTVQLEDRELEIARRVYDLCGLPCRSAINLCEGDNPLLRLNLNQFAVLLLSLAGHIHYLMSEHVSPSILTKLSLTVSDLHGALERAFNAFQNWPRGLHEFLDWASPRATGYRQWTPAQRLDRLYNCLINFSEELGVDMIRTIEDWQNRNRRRERI